MNFVVATETGVIELNFLWLPTWLGMNPELCKELQGVLEKEFVSRDLNEAVLFEASTRTIDFLCERFSEIEGLRDYLDGIKFVSFR